MKTKQIIRSMFVAGLLAAGVALPAFAKEEQEDGQTVDWASVPVAVQSTITAHANGGTISKVETEVKKGATVYEAEVKCTDGKELDVKVAADGTLIKAKAEDDGKDGKGEKEEKDDKD